MEPFLLHNLPQALSEVQTFIELHSLFDQVHWCQKPIMKYSCNHPDSSICKPMQFSIIEREIVHGKFVRREIKSMSWNASRGNDVGSPEESQYAVRPVETHTSSKESKSLFGGLHVCLDCVNRIHAHVL